MPFCDLSITSKIQVIVGVILIIYGVVMIYSHPIQYDTNIITALIINLTNTTVSSGVSLVGLGMAFVTIGYNEPHERTHPNT